MKILTSFHYKLIVIGSPGMRRHFPMVLNRETCPTIFTLKFCCFLLFNSSYVKHSTSGKVLISRLHYSLRLSVSKTVQPSNSLKSDVRVRLLALFKPGTNQSTMVCLPARCWILINLQSDDVITVRLSQI